MEKVRVRGEGNWTQGGGWIKGGLGVGNRLRKWGVGGMYEVGSGGRVKEKRRR